MTTENLTVFKTVFQEVPFPYLGIDMYALLGTILVNQGEPQSYYRMSLEVSAEKQKALEACWTGFLEKSSLPDSYKRFILNSPILLFIFKDEGKVKELVFKADDGSILIRDANSLVWQDTSLLPIAYATLLGQLTNIIAVFKVALEKRHEELRTTTGFDGNIVQAEYPRFMPTSIHYAFASLGAWLGGAANFQYFSYYATTPQINNKQLNINYGQKNQYSLIEAQSLDDSGIINLPSSLMLPILQAQGKHQMIGLHVDEFNIANMPSIEEGVVHHKNLMDEGRFGFILDKYYRTSFYARKIRKLALYGAQDVLRDHYTEFYKSITYRDLIRCKHYCAPIIDVGTVEEMSSIISRIPIRDKTNGIFFRGQTSLYQLSRTKEVKEFLFGNSCSVEPSLSTSAARRNFNYDQLHFCLKYHIQTILFHHVNDNNFADFRKKMVRCKLQSNVYF